MPRIIRAADLQPRPWPNGLGVTRDITVGDGWLITVADLTGDAAFSHFPETDRIFTLLGGAGVTLELEGRPPLSCLPWVPTSFPGDVPTFCRMEGGPARAFNVMASRRHEARVAVRSIAAGHSVRSTSRCAAIFCIEESLTVGDERLGAGDTMLHPGATAIEGPGLAIMVDI